MESINQNQAGDHIDHLEGQEAAKKVKELCEKAKTCFFCTSTSVSGPFSTRPMAVQKIDDNGTCWFLSAKDSIKNKEIMTDPSVQLLFQVATHSGFVSLFGRAEISTDRLKIKELWEPLLKNWFTEGENDPRITVIKFDPHSGYYWDTKNGQIVAFAKYVTGALTGKTMDDSIEGSLNL